MPTSRSRKRKRKRPLPPPPPPPKAPPPTIRRILASWWVRGVALLGFVATLWALADASGEFRPTIAPVSDSSAPTEFRVENKNPLIDMTDSTLVCNVESADFETDRGLMGFSIQVTSGATNTLIYHRG